MNDAATNVGGLYMYGVNVLVDSSSTGGTTENIAFKGIVTDGDTNYGLWLQCEDGAGADIKLLSSASAVDYFTIDTKEDGETTFTTVEHGAGSTAHMNFNADGDINLNPSMNASSSINMLMVDSDSTKGIKGTIDGVANECFIFHGVAGDVTELRLYAGGGDTNALNDFMYISCWENGETHISTVDADATLAHIEINPNGNLNFKPSTGDTTFSSPLSAKPLVTLKSTNTTKTTSAELKFAKDAANVEDEEVLGQVSFYGDNHGSAQTKHADITVKVNDVSAGNYSLAEMNFNILNANQGGDSYNTGLKLFGKSDNDRDIDVNIASGIESVTTIAGELDIDGAKITSAGNLTIDTVGDLSLDAHTAKDIFFKEAATERFHFHLDATPTMEVTGNFDIDCSGDIEINADGGAVTLKDDSDTMVSFTTKGMDGNRRFVAPSSTVGAHTGGDIYYYGDGSTVKGKIYYIDGTNWTLADADAEASTKGLLAVALGTDPNVDGMLLRGFVTLLTEIEGTEAIGSPLYLSATDSGVATITVPASGDFVRVLGYSLHATDNQVYFNPDNTWVQRA